MKYYHVGIFAIIIAAYLVENANATENFNEDIWDWSIFRQDKQWRPTIVSGPTILVASNITTIHDKNGEGVNVQLSNNNVGIGK